MVTHRECSSHTNNFNSQFQNCLYLYDNNCILCTFAYSTMAGSRSAVGNVSGYRCVSNCRSRGRDFDPGPVQYFRGDWSWNNFFGHSPPFRWFIQEGLFSVTSESMCTNYWLTACSSLSRKIVVMWTDRPAMTIAVDLRRKSRKQANTAPRGLFPYSL